MQPARIKSLPHLAAAADMMPEPTKEKFMTAAEAWMLEGLEKGLEKGLETGLAKGMAKGREEGERAALAAVVLVQARLRFRDVPAEAVARMNKEMLALQAAMGSFGKIAGLTLFDYIGR